MASIEAKTTQVSRTFDGNFLLTWTPADTGSSLAIEFKAGGSSLFTYTFTPDSPTADVDGATGIYSVKGKLYALYDNSGAHGTLATPGLVFTSNSNPASFQGSIGTW